jgi:hypothetical protein
MPLNIGGNIVNSRSIDNAGAQMRGVVRDGLVLYLDAGNANSYSSSRQFVAARIYSVFNGLRSANYSVQWSDDNSNWTTAFSGVMSNNSDYGVQTGTITSSSPTIPRRYWRYVEGSAVNSHHPRVSRIMLVTNSGDEITLRRYTEDNQADGGEFQIGTVTVDFASVWTDLTLNGHNFNINSGAFNSGGPKYMDFNGSYGCAKNSTDISLSDTNGVTYIVWTRVLNSASNWRTLTRSYINDHHVIIQAGAWDIGIYDNDSAGFLDSGYDQTSLPGYNSGVWNMMVFRYRPSSPHYILTINNSNETTRGSISNENARYNRGFGSLGAYHNGNTDVNNASQYWGDVAIFQVYNRELNSRELNQNYYATVPRFGTGYYDCGYGCQYYTFNPGCTACTGVDPPL